MENPFQQIDERLQRIEAVLNSIQNILNNSTGTPNEPDRLLTINQAGEIINLTAPTIYALVGKKQIPHIKKGKRLYFFKSELLDWIKSGRRKTLAETDAEAEEYINRKSNQRRL